MNIDPLVSVFTKFLNSQQRHASLASRLHFRLELFLPDLSVENVLILVLFLNYMKIVRSSYPRSYCGGGDHNKFYLW